MSLEGILTHGTGTQDCLLEVKQKAGGFDAKKEETVDAQPQISLRAVRNHWVQGLPVQYVSDQPTTVIVSTSNSTPVLTMLSVLPCPNR